MKADDLLKVSQTTLEEILDGETATHARSATLCQSSTLSPSGLGEGKGKRKGGDFSPYISGVQGDASPRSGSKGQGGYSGGGESGGRVKRRRTSPGGEGMEGGGWRGGGQKVGGEKEDEEEDGDYDDVGREMEREEDEREEEEYMREGEEVERREERGDERRIRSDVRCPSPKGKRTHSPTHSPRSHFSHPSSSHPSSSHSKIESDGASNEIPYVLDSTNTSDKPYGQVRDSGAARGTGGRGTGGEGGGEEGGECYG